MPEDFNCVTPVGIVKSELKERNEAPPQGDEGAPPAWLMVDEDYRPAIDGLEVGDEILILTWLHRASRDVLRVHPRGDVSRVPNGVFATRSPDRPNPIGLHPVRILKRTADGLLVAPLEAIDGTLILDIKPVLAPPDKR